MRTCDRIAEFLLSRGIRDFFGFQGGAVTPLIDALVMHGMRYHQCLHEQASGFAAEAWSRVTGKTGVVVVTNGPGATNVLSAVANANLDSTPCLFLFGQVNRADIKKDGSRQNGFQEVDSLGMARPVCKLADAVMDPGEICTVLSRAFHVAESGRKGAVCLDVPMDVLLSESLQPSATETSPVEYGPATIQDVMKAAEMLSSAERPAILAGAGVRASGATDALRRFADSSGIPVAKTLMGLDSLYGECAGFSGVYGHVAANRAILESDVLLVLGSRLAKRQIGKSIEAYAPNAKIIHVDISPEELGDLPPADLMVKADAGSFLSSLAEVFVPGDYSRWTEKILQWKCTYAAAPLRNQGFDPVGAVQALSVGAPDDIVATFDVGQNEMWCAQGWEVKRGQRVLASGGLGCMGFSVPAAIGAAIAGRRAWAFTGDGGLQMNIQELQTIASRKLPVKVFVFNNQSLGMIQEGQAKYHDGRYYGTKSGYTVPDLQMIANAYGLRYARFTFEDTPAIAAMEGPVMVEIGVSGSPSRVLTRYDNPEDYM